MTDTTLRAHPACDRDWRGDSDSPQRGLAWWADTDAGGRRFFIEWRSSKLILFCQLKPLVSFYLVDDETNTELLAWFVAPQY